MTNTHYPFDGQYAEQPGPAGQHAQYPEYAQYPHYASYPHYGQYGQYGQYPQYASYPQYPTYGPDGRWTPPPGYSDFAGHPSAYGSPSTTTPPPAPKRRGRTGAVAGAVAVAAAAVLGLSLVGANTTTSGTGSVAAGQFPAQVPGNLPGASPNSGRTAPSTNQPNSTNGNNSATTDATTAQTVGVVDIYTKLKYQQAAAAGTGMVLTSNGYILTNNHVIDGSTAIRAVVVSTGKTYPATVVGTAPTKDIAVIKLKDASGLQTAHFGDSDSVKVGDPVTGVGNAGGSGGVPSAASGKITGLGKTITASDETGTDSEKLHGIIVTDAPIRSGDSGGPLFNASNQVVGIDTAASTSGQTAGFSIPIDTARSIADEIRSGHATSVIHIGYPAFLGVGVQDAQGQGAMITTTEPGLPADKAGIVAGDVITAANGKTVTSATSLRTAISTVKPGDTVSITYRDANGGSHTTQATLITGPAD